MKKVSMFVCCVLGSMGLATANISYANMPNNASGTSIHPRTSDSSDNTNAKGNNKNDLNSEDNKSNNKSEKNHSKMKLNKGEKAPVMDKHTTDQSQTQVQGQGQSLTQ